MTHISPFDALNNTERHALLRAAIDDYEQVKDTILTGLDRITAISRQKQRIMEQLGVGEKQWNDYHWQLQHRFTDITAIQELIGLTKDDCQAILQVGQAYRYAISPYYLSLIDPANPHCPVRRQAIPDIAELDSRGELDPMDEAGWAINEIITRRYPDRLIIKVTNNCGMYCRFCQRRRLIGTCDTQATHEQIAAAIRYVRDNPEIRDVLITGGDAFLLEDHIIEWLLADLRAISHVEIIRFGTRTPVTLPQRITPELVGILKKYHPVFVNTHFNTPAEITEESRQACNRLADAGIPLGNQMVLLNGVNNDPFVIRKLNQALLRLRVKPYYIFHPKTVKGTSHFWVPIQEGLEIMESLRGRTSGLAVPTYIVNGPHGLGKTPLLPNYLIYIGKDKAVLRNWQGIEFEIEN